MPQELQTKRAAAWRSFFGVFHWGFHKEKRGKNHRKTIGSHGNVSPKASDFGFCWMG